MQYLGKSLTWSDGRQLSSMVDGDLSVGYTYGTNGIRLSKTVDGVQTKYVLNGAQILQQITGSETLNFYYDASGQISSIGYIDGSAAEICYFVTRNQQGDVVALYRSADASLVGTYTYDSWGKVMAITPASPRGDNVFPPRPAGKQSLALVHTHGAYSPSPDPFGEEVFNEEFSPDWDIKTLDNENLIGYLATPGANYCAIIP